MNKSWQIPRRTFLKGLGTSIAVPMLEAMAPVKSLAAAGEAATAFPRRMGFVYIPNGVIMEHWRPRIVGPNFDLPATLQPLAPVKNDLMVLSGFAHDKAFANGDGAGDHARANATFLTAVQARKTAGADIRLGVSIDQVAANQIGRYTKLPSLELSCDKARQAGSCDSGYSCAYQFNLAWKNETMPMAPENDPRLVFERLFGGSSASENAKSRAIRKEYNKSILDFALDDAKALQRNLGTTDRRKLDEYLEAVRELETRIDKAEKFTASIPDYQKPSGIPRSNRDHIRLMFDLMTLAFQTDTTRVCTFLIAHDGSNRNYKDELGIGEGHHHLSHHKGDESWIRSLQKIDTYHMQQFAYFIQRLKTIREGDGTLLDNCMIMCGGGISDGNRHRHDDLPILMAGRAGGTIRPGRHVKLDKVPLANVFLSMLDRMGTPIPRFGDSTGRFTGLA
jgi:hypothetical protein